MKASFSPCFLDVGVCIKIAVVAFFSLVYFGLQLSEVARTRVTLPGVSLVHTQPWAALCAPLFDRPMLEMLADCVAGIERTFENTTRNTKLRWMHRGRYRVRVQTTFLAVTAPVTISLSPCFSFFSLCLFRSLYLCRAPQLARFYSDLADLQEHSTVSNPDTVLQLRQMAKNELAPLIQRGVKDATYRLFAVFRSEAAVFRDIETYFLCLA